MRPIIIRGYHFFPKVTILALFGGFCDFLHNLLKVLPEQILAKSHQKTKIIKKSQFQDTPCIKAHLAKFKELTPVPSGGYKNIYTCINGLPIIQATPEYHM